MRNDINLLQKKQSSVSRKTLTYILIISIFVIICFSGICVVLPNISKGMIQNNITNKEKELQSYAAVEAEYQEALNNTTEIKEQINTIDQLKNNTRSFTQIFDDIQVIMPQDITLTKMNYHDDSIDMEGIALEVVNIAQFMVKLRQLEYVQSVKVTSSELDTESEEGYSYKITMTFITEQTEATTENETTQDEEGGE